MEIFNDFKTNKNLSLALGFFDGMHLGHCCVVKNAVKFAKEKNISSAVITFENAPKSFFSKQEDGTLISKESRLEKFSQLGIDFVYIVPFTERLASLSAAEYLNDIIIKNFSPQAITTGFNHSFGRDRQGADFLRENQDKFNYKYYEIPPITFCNQLISTSEIKNALAENDFEKAKNLLGYYFSIEGEVIEGQKIGRTINYPTANILYPHGITDLSQGVYCGFAIIDDRPYKGILNYGVKPTVTNENKKVLEFNIFNFNHDIYGKKIKIIPIKKIREEKKFSSLENLKAQLAQDEQSAKNCFRQF